MTDYIWSKNPGADGDDAASQTRAAIMAFMAGDDVLLDRELLPFDIRASQAHAKGLQQAGILDEDEVRQLVGALDDIGKAFRAGELQLDEQFEDGHSALEAWLTERLGDLGRKIHTGRSRNDQVAVAMRLWLRQQLEDLAGVCAAIARACLAGADQGRATPMPGYTHLQRAMPSSLGLWFAGHAEAFIDNAALARQTAHWLNASPLGTASGFGVNLPLPREQVAQALGFERQVVNPQYAQNARGKVELQALGALAAATGDLRRLAWDLSLFATAEFGFVRLPAAYCTGSSIMPNKHNPDAVELLRGLHAVISGAQAELTGMLSLPSGYQRDLQGSKPPALRAFRQGLAGLALVPELVAGLQWDEPRMLAAISADMHATDFAMERAAAGEPFRLAYRAAAEAMDQLGQRQAADSLAQRVSPGGCADLGLAQLAERLAALEKD